MDCFPSRGRLLWLVCLLPLSAWAQSPESDLAPGSEHLALDSSHFAWHDISDKTLAKAQIEDSHDRFDVKFGVVALTDYTFFDQDADSITQVGRQDDDFEVRSLRLMARGFFELGARFDYVISYEYKGFANQPGDPDWASSDFTVATKLGSVGTLKLGKMKEPHVYEEVGDAANLPFSERLLNPFFVSRNVGVQLSNQLPGQRGMWTVGIYNDWLTEDQSLSDSGYDVAARVTLVPLWQDDGARYVHLGASLRYQQGDDNQVRLKGQPASHVADNYVDTGNIDADHAVNLGLEALWSVNQYSLLGEYVVSRVSTLDAPNATLDGWYVAASWVVTGDRRPYDRKVGYARRVLPQGRWGAVELTARVGNVNLDDGVVAGGRMDGWWLGVNWWASRRWKAGLSWGSVDLDRFGTTGNTKMLLGRLQWIY